MPDRMTIREDVTVGAQPSVAELRAMSQDGVKTVINLRHDGEDLMPLTPGEEGQEVRMLGMAYEPFPVSMKDAGPDLVDRFRAVLDEAEKPVFVHCKLGKRAGAMVMMDQAVREGWSGDETLDKARGMGFECDNQEMETFVKTYVDAHAQ